MSYPKEDYDAGYPKFSEVHEYPDPYKENRRRKAQYAQNKYEYSEKHKHKHKKKSKNKHNPKPTLQTKPIAGAPIQMVPKNQLYMSQGGHKYMAVPVGKPKLVPMAVTKPQYQMAQPNYAMPYYQTQPMYAQPYAQPYPQPYAQPYAYPYYGQPQARPKTVVVLPPGYKRDYSAGYSPWGNLEEDLDNIF